MKEKKIVKYLEKAIKKRLMCKVYLSYRKDEEPCRFIPLAMSDKLVLTIKDGDLAANGYTIRQIEDIEKLKVEDSFGKSNIADNDIEKKVLKLDIKDWPNALASLAKLGRVVVVQSEKLVQKEGSFAIGKIEKVGRKQIAVIRYYGPDSAWDDKKWKIPYEDITRVTFGSRYTEVLTKYLPKTDETLLEAEDLDADPETAEEAAETIETAEEAIEDSVENIIKDIEDEEN